MLSWYNNYILKMYIFYKYKYFSSFEAGNCFSNSSFKWLKNSLKKIGSIMVNVWILRYLYKNISAMWWLIMIKKWKESGFRPPLCTYRLNWPGEPPEDGEMIEMTLSSRHRIRNSSPGGLRPSTLPFGHGGSPQYWLSHVDGEETYLFLSNCRDREPNPELRRERQRC